MSDAELMTLVKQTDPLTDKRDDAADRDGELMLAQILSTPRSDEKPPIPRRRRPVIVVAVLAAVVFVPAAVAFRHQVAALFVTSSVPSELGGAYSATVTGLTPASLDGRWTLRFAALSDYGGVHGSYYRVHNGITVATGGFSFSANAQGTSLFLRDLYGPSACSDNGPVGGVYSLHFNGNSITLTPQIDKCAARRKILTAAHTFTRP